MQMEEMFKEFEFNEKPEEMITELNGMPLPEDYLAFMREHNGGEGPLGENNYGCFYRLEELAEVNAEYDVPNNWPGYVVLGSDEIIISGTKWEAARQITVQPPGKPNIPRKETTWKNISPTRSSRKRSSGS